MYAKRRVRPSAVVEGDVSADGRSRLRHAVVGPQIHFLVLDTAPEALEEDVVAPRVSAVHADRDLVCDERVGEGAR